MYLLSKLFKINIWSVVLKFVQYVAWLSSSFPDKFQCMLQSKTPDPEFCIYLGDTVMEPSDTVGLLGIASVWVDLYIFLIYIFFKSFF